MRGAQDQREIAWRRAPESRDSQKGQVMPIGLSFDTGTRTGRRAMNAFVTARNTAARCMRCTPGVYRERRLLAASSDTPSGPGASVFRAAHLNYGFWLVASAIFASRPKSPS